MLPFSEPKCAQVDLILYSESIFRDSPLRWLSTYEFSCASSVSDSFCRVDTASTETVCEFIATVESRLADSFLSRGYGHDACLSDSLRVLAATSKRFYSARNSTVSPCRISRHDAQIPFLCDEKSRNCRAGAQDVYSCYKIR